VTDNYWDDHSDEDRITEVRELVRWIDTTRPADMDQMFYVHYHEELMLAVRDLLDILERRPA